MAKNKKSKKAKKTTLKAIAKAAKPERDTPVHDDPREELRRLVRKHNALTKASVALTHMASDRKNRETGETIPCLLPEDDRVDLLDTATRRKKSAKKMETAMLRQLRQIPIYQHFLAGVYGCGPVVAAYLVAEIDIHKSVKISNLKRFCGLAVFDGRLERRTKGQRNYYHSGMRTRLYQMMDAMRKNCRKSGVTTKYVTIWDDYKHRAAHMQPEPEKKGKAESKGRWKACDVFIEDLYTVWRALEGLPVWPSYHDGVLRGHKHGGEKCHNVPVDLTVERALEVVGSPGPVPLMADAAE